MARKRMTGNFLSGMGVLPAEKNPDHLIMKQGSNLFAEI